MIKQTDIRPETPENFMNLVFMMKKLGQKNIEELYQYAAECEHNQTTTAIIENALPLVQTESSIKFMVKKIIEGNLNSRTRFFWFSSIFVLKSPTKEILSALKPLLIYKDNYIPDQKVMLVVSAVANEFCVRGSGSGADDCRQTKELTDIVDLLIKNLNKRCSYTDEKSRIVV